MPQQTNAAGSLCNGATLTLACKPQARQRNGGCARWLTQTVASTGMQALRNAAVLPAFSRTPRPRTMLEPCTATVLGDARSAGTSTAYAGSHASQQLVSRSANTIVVASTHKTLYRSKPGPAAAPTESLKNYAIASEAQFTNWNATAVAAADATRNLAAYQHPQLPTISLAAQNSR